MIDHEEKLQWTCANIHLGKDRLWEALLEFPSIQFGIEMAFQSLVRDLFTLSFGLYGWCKIDGDKRFSLDG
jgi:hypothetical protein